MSHSRGRAAPPRVHRQRYHGVLAPNARLRSRLTAWAREATRQETGQAADAPAAFAPCHDPPPTAEVSTPYPGRAAPAHHSPAAPLSAARSRWARLLARIYEVFPLLCPDCGAQLRILAFLTQPEPVHAILHHLGLPTRPPPLSPARGPPELELDFEAELDQTPAFDPADPEPIPDFDFDQSRGG